MNVGLAAKLRPRVAQEDNPLLRAEWQNLAECYIRLAEQSEDDLFDATRDPIFSIGGIEKPQH
jgi:hypothetical protein